MNLDSIISRVFTKQKVDAFYNIREKYISLNIPALNDQVLISDEEIKRLDILAFIQIF